MALWIGRHKIEQLWVNGKAVSALWLGAKLIWRRLTSRSCYDSGRWRHEQPWTSEDAWTSTDR